MGLPMLQQCICGMKIRTGALIVAWMGLVFQTISLLWCTLVVTSYFSLPEKDVNEWFKDAPGEYELTDESKRNLHSGLGFLLCFALVLTLAGFAIELCLVIGIYKKNHCLMLPRIIIYGISSCITLIVTAIWSLFLMASILQLLFSAGGGLPALNMFIVLVLLAIESVVVCYFFLVLFTHYRNIKYERKQNAMKFEKL